MFIIALLITVVVLIAYFLCFVIKKHRCNEILKKVPSPPEIFFFGHLHILTDTDRLFTKIRRFSKKYYPIYRFSTPYVNIVHLLDPNDIELVLSSTRHLSKSKIYTFLYNWLGTGLLTSTGAKWHKRRKILTPAFHFSILHQFVEVFNEESLKLVEILENYCGENVDVVPPITNFTLQSIMETAMGVKGVDSSTKRYYKNAVHDMGKIILKRVAKPWYCFDPIYKLSKLSREETTAVAVLHDFSNNIIKKRKQKTQSVASNKRLALLDLLLSAQTKGADIDHDGIREEVDTFTFEGHDTTSMAISFLLLTLSNLQDVQTKVLTEILRVVGPTKVPSYDDLQELKYTERCIKETLRLFPSVPFISRFASEDFTTKTGYDIPKGTVLHIHIYDVHRNKKIYSDPEKFDPDRFLPENVNERHPFAYIPFSAGPRNCIGQRFAFLELKAVLCGILRKFKLEKVDDMNEVEFRPDLVLRPKKEVRVKILPRHIDFSL